MTKISVLIPTFRRPDSFLRAARSVLAQQGVESFELIAVDNSPEGSALSAFEQLARETQRPFRWTHAPTPGVAQARNAALMLAQGELVAWLDDDEEAEPGWLSALLAARVSTGAQSVFGPVVARAPEGARFASFSERIYARTGPASTGVCAKSYGIGNSLQPRSLFDGAAPFDTGADQTGGEDDRLFASLQEAGAIFAWASDARVIEHLGAERVRIAHGLKRAFAYGQGPCETAWEERAYFTLCRHMATGAAQALVFGLASAVVVAGSTNKALALLDGAARGAGKVFWFLEQRFYGQALAVQPI